MKLGLKGAGLKRFIVGLFTLILIGLAGIGFVSAEKASNIAEIEGVIKEAVTAAFTLPELPSEYTAMSANYPKSMSDSVKVQMKRKIANKLSNVYVSGSEIQKRRTEDMEGAVNSQEDGQFRSLGGGIKGFSNLVVNFDDADHATATVDIKVFSKFRENGKVFSPEGINHYKFSLAKGNGTWRISKEEFEVDPGDI